MISAGRRAYLVVPEMGTWTKGGRRTPAAGHVPAPSVRKPRSPGVGWSDVRTAIRWPNASGPAAKAEILHPKLVLNPVLLVEEPPFRFHRIAMGANLYRHSPRGGR